MVTRPLICAYKSATSQHFTTQTIRLAIVRPSVHWALSVLMLHPMMLSLLVSTTVLTIPMLVIVIVFAWLIAKLDYLETLLLVFVILIHFHVLMDTLQMMCLISV